LKPRKEATYRIFCPEPLVSPLTTFFNQEHIDFELPVEETPQEFGFDIVSMFSIIVSGLETTEKISRFARKMYELLKKNRKYSIRIQTPLMTTTLSCDQMKTFSNFLKAITELEV